jgi:hypothetical protein
MESRDINPKYEILTMIQLGCSPRIVETARYRFFTCKCQSTDLLQRSLSDSSYIGCGVWKCETELYVFRFRVQ